MLAASPTLRPNSVESTASPTTHHSSSESAWCAMICKASKLPHSCVDFSSVRCAALNAFHSRFGTGSLTTPMVYAMAAALRIVLTEQLPFPSRMASHTTCSTTLYGPHSGRAICVCRSRRIPVWYVPSDVVL